MINMMPYAVSINFLVHAVLIASTGVQCQDNLNKWLCIAVVTGLPTCLFFQIEVTSKTDLDEVVRYM